MQFERKWKRLAKCLLKLQFRAVFVTRWLPACPPGLMLASLGLKHFLPMYIVQVSMVTTPRNTKTLTDMFCERNDLGIKCFKDRNNLCRFFVLFVCLLLFCFVVFVLVFTPQVWILARHLNRSITLSSDYNLNTNLKSGEMSRFVALFCFVVMRIQNNLFVLCHIKLAFFLIVHVFGSRCLVISMTSSALIRLYTPSALSSPPTLSLPMSLWWRPRKLRVVFMR